MSEFAYSIDQTFDQQQTHGYTINFAAVSILAAALFLQLSLVSDVRGDAACTASLAYPGQCENVGGGCRGQDECCVYISATTDCVCTALLNCATFGSRGTSAKLGRAKRLPSFWIRNEA